MNGVLAARSGHRSALCRACDEIARKSRFHESVLSGFFRAKARNMNKSELFPQRGGVAASGRM